MFIQFTRQILLQCSHHAWSLGQGSLDHEFQTSFFSGLCGVVTKGADNSTVLLVFRKIIEETLYAAWSKEANYVVVILAENLLYVRALCTIHESKGVLAFICLEPCYNFIILLVLGADV